MTLSHIGGDTMFDITVPFYSIRFYSLDMSMPPKGYSWLMYQMLDSSVEELSRGIIASSIDKLTADSLLVTGL